MCESKFYICEKCGNIVGKMCILAEGDAVTRGDIIFLEELPLFRADGSVIK